MKKIILSTATMLAAVVHASTPNHLTGNYHCIGNDIKSHSTFTCKMQLSKTGETYANHADCNDGTSYQGTGIYEESKHALALVASNPTNPKDISVAMVDVQKNGALSYKWTYLNSKTIGYIECKKSS